MSLRRFLTKIRNTEADRSSLGKDRTTTYTSIVTSTPSNTLPGRGSVRQPEYSPSDTLGVAEASQVATPNYSKRPYVSNSNSHLRQLLVYYRIFAEDGAIPSKKTFGAGDPFLGRIKDISVPPPCTVKAVKFSIAAAENIKDDERTSLFLTPFSQSPMDDAKKLTFLNRTGTGPGSTPQEPLALVVKMSDSERSALESDGRGLASGSAAEHTTSPEIQYRTSILFFLLFVL